MAGSRVRMWWLAVVLLLVGSGLGSDAAAFPVTAVSATAPPRDISRSLGVPSACQVHEDLSEICWPGAHSRVVIDGETFQGTVTAARRVRLGRRKHYVAVVTHECIIGCLGSLTAPPVGVAVYRRQGMQWRPVVLREQVLVFGSYGVTSGSPVIRKVGRRVMVAVRHTDVRQGIAATSEAVVGFRRGGLRHLTRARLLRVGFDNTASFACGAGGDCRSWSTRTSFVRSGKSWPDLRLRYDGGRSGSRRFEVRKGTYRPVRFHT